jgi:hypothetical protein
MKVNKKMLLVILMLAVVGIVLFFFSRENSSPVEKKINYSNYVFELDTIESIRKGLTPEANIKKAKKLFVENITSRIFKYWYGTPWDFNGTTQKPQEGSIACGYFVTTTLRDMGVPINRVKMAQCASEEMISSLVVKKNIHRFSNVSLKDFEKKMNVLGEGLYVIGLDNHTGFVQISSTGNYFIHASGWYPYKVVKDVVAESSILSNSKYRVVGKISDDETFLKNWIKGSE